jgi:DNA replication and repair protein RecF
MFLQQLNLLNFKNYEEASFSFSSGVNCFVGNNGAGKTNLLDSIHYLSFCKSYFNPIDSQNIYHDAPFFIVQGTFENEHEKDTVYCAVKRGQKKQFKRNQKEYQRLADHIGVYPMVMISPMDSNLISAGSEERRKFMDSIISQYDKIYLDDLISYNKIISQRNALLKHFSDSGSFDMSSIEIWDVQLVVLCEKIYSKRKLFIDEFIPVFRHFFQFIAGTDELVDIVYDSQLHSGNFERFLQATISKDRALGYTTAGIHKDDLIFYLKGNSIKKFGSQGQQKSFLIGLKLAQFDLLKKLKAKKPILLLDDIFDKLDILRINRLMELVSMESFGQLFITDSHPERIADVFKAININIRMFTIEGGTVVNQEV